MRWELKFLTEQQLQEKKLIKTNLKAPCFICGINTEFVHYATRTFNCSEECLKELEVRSDFKSDYKYDSCILNGSGLDCEDCKHSLYEDGGQIEWCALLAKGYACNFEEMEDD